jgi:hypothetical protein
LPPVRCFASPACMIMFPVSASPTAFSMLIEPGLPLLATPVAITMLPLLARVESPVFSWKYPDDLVDAEEYNAILPDPEDSDPPLRISKTPPLPFEDMPLENTISPPEDPKLSPVRNEIAMGFDEKDEGDLIVTLPELPIVLPPLMTVAKPLPDVKSPCPDESTIEPETPLFESPEVTITSPEEKPEPELRAKKPEPALATPELTVTSPDDSEAEDLKEMEPEQP